MIELKLEDGVYHAILAHGACNEIGSVMLRSLEDLVQELEKGEGRALILSSALESGFCAGADLRELYKGFQERPKEEHESALEEFLDRIHNVMNRLDMLPMTTIGVIHGVCFGGGFELALTCDILIAEKTARFCFPELRLGILPGFGGIPRLKRDVGNALVRDLLLTGRSINAKKAREMGLVSQLAAKGEGLNIARAMAKQASHFDAEAASTTKAFIKALPKEELEQEKQHFLRLVQRPVVLEALRRFVESQDIRPYL